MLHIKLNYSGDHRCDGPSLRETDPFHADMIKDFLEGWEALSCTDLMMPNINGAGSLFAAGPAYAKDYARVKGACNDKYGHAPDFDFIMREFGGYNPKEDFKGYTNLITLNGDTDPWLPGCLQDQVNEDMPVLTVRNGAHHTDSFMPIPGEDQVGLGSNLKDVRAQVESHLSKWFA